MARSITVNNKVNCEGSRPQFVLSITKHQYIAGSSMWVRSNLLFGSKVKVFILHLSIYD